MTDPTPASPNSATHRRANMTIAMIDRLAASLVEAHSRDAHTDWCAFQTLGCECGYSDRYEAAESVLEDYRLMAGLLSSITPEGHDVALVIHPEEVAPDRCYMRADGRGGCETHDSPWPIGQMCCAAALQDEATDGR